MACGALPTSAPGLAAPGGSGSTPLRRPTPSAAAPRPPSLRRRRGAAPRAAASGAGAAAPKPDPFATREVYADADPLSRFMIRYFSAAMSRTLGGAPYDGTYAGFVELSRGLVRGRTSAQQREAVAGVLSSLLPPQAPARFRAWFPLNRRNAEFNAWITTLGFQWLVGPAEVREVEVEFEGRKEVWRSGVHIKKCRYLEASGCVGLCTNLCKVPTQRFFTETFGLPLQMDPNFEDLSCDMKFGVHPTPLEQDPVYAQPCFSVCDIASNRVAAEGRRAAAGAAAPADAAAAAAPCPRTDSER